MESCTDYATCFDLNAVCDVDVHYSSTGDITLKSDVGAAIIHACILRASIKVYSPTSDYIGHLGEPSNAKFCQIFAFPMLA